VPAPQRVNTGLLGRNENDEQQPADDGGGLRSVLGEVVEPKDCADSALESLDAGHFLALPHPRVGESFARKATNYDAWLAANQLAGARGGGRQPGGRGSVRAELLGALATRHCDGSSDPNHPVRQTVPSTSASCWATRA